MFEPVALQTAPPPPTEGGDRPPGVQDPIEKRKMSEITLFQSSMRHSRHNNNSINNSNNNSINNSNNNSINSISSSPTTKANGTRHKHLSCESVHSCNNTDVSKPSKKGADEAKESPYSCNGDDDASVKERGGRGSEDEGRRNELKNGENDLTGKYNDVGLDTKQAPTEESENKQSVEALHADVTQEASKPATSVGLCDVIVLFLCCLYAAFVPCALCSLLLLQHHLQPPPSRSRRRRWPEEVTRSHVSTILCSFSSLIHHPFTCSSIYPSIHPPIHIFTHPFIHPCSHSPIHPPMHPFTHPCTTTSSPHRGCPVQGTVPGLHTAGVGGTAFQGHPPHAGPGGHQPHQGHSSA